MDRSAAGGRGAQPDRRWRRTHRRARRALDDGDDIVTAARRSVAAAAASVEAPRAGDLDPARMAELLGVITPN